MIKVHRQLPVDHDRSDEHQRSCADGQHDLLPTDGNAGLAEAGFSGDEMESLCSIEVSTLDVEDKGLVANPHDAAGLASLGVYERLQGALDLIKCDESVLSQDPSP